MAFKVDIIGVNGSEKVFGDFQEACGYLKELLENYRIAEFSVVPDTDPGAEVPVEGEGAPTDTAVAGDEDAETTEKPASAPIGESAEEPVEEPIEEPASEDATDEPISDPKDSLDDDTFDDDDEDDDLDDETV